jgi:hypothetical protein
MADAKRDGKRKSELVMDQSGCLATDRWLHVFIVEVLGRYASAQGIG